MAGITQRHEPGASRALQRFAVTFLRAERGGDDSGFSRQASNVTKGKREEGKGGEGAVKERTRAAHERGLGLAKSVLDRFRLDGKVALVTGGARGLGKTMATALAEAGANIALAGRSKDTCQEAATDIASATGRKAAGVCRRRDEARRRRAAGRRRRARVRADRHPRQQRGHQHSRSDSAVDRGRLGCGGRHEPERPVSLRARVRSTDGEPRLGPRHQSGIGARRDCAARAAPRTRRPRPASST